MKFLVTMFFLLVASICSGQETTQLEQLRETKIHGNWILGGSLRGQMKFAEECLAELNVQRRRVAEEIRKNIPGQSRMVNVHREQLPGYEMLAKAALARVAYMVSEPGALRGRTEYELFRRWEKEAWRQLQGKRPRVAKLKNRALSARFPTRE